MMDGREPRLGDYITAVAAFIAALLLSFGAGFIVVDIAGNVDIPVAASGGNSKEIATRFFVGLIPLSLLAALKRSLWLERIRASADRLGLKPVRMYNWDGGHGNGIPRYSVSYA